MTCAVEQAIVLNNEAACLVSTGHLVDASCALQHAVRVLWMSTHHGKPSAIPPVLAEWHKATGSAVTHDRSGFNPEGKMYIQDRLLCLSPASICLGQDDRYLHNVITSLTLYNLALVHHLLSRVAVCETSLMRARALYERVICVTSNWPTKDWLHCLILNNLADIHNELCAYDRSKDCLTMLANIAKKTRCLDDCAIVSDSEMQGINLNYALAQFHTPAPAA